MNCRAISESSTVTMSWGSSVIFALFLFIQTASLSEQTSQASRCAHQVVKLRDQQGTLESPSFPQPYAPRQICIWHIRVSPGYKVHLHFARPFDVHDSAGCAADYVVVSTRPQRFTGPASSQQGKYAVVFCGARKPSNVTSASQELWVRFQAKHGGSKGFRAFYVAQDINECDRANAGCQYQCVNEVGSYKCKCPDGFHLKEDGKACQKNRPPTQVSFTKTRYRAVISTLAPVRTSIVTVRGNSTGDDVKFVYRIVSIDDQAPGPRSLFAISRSSGTILVNRKLRTPGRYRLLVKATTQDGAYTQTTVVVRVVKRAGERLKVGRMYFLNLGVKGLIAQQHNSVLCSKTNYSNECPDVTPLTTKRCLTEETLPGFSSPAHSVIIPEVIPRGRVILHLNLIKSDAFRNASVTFRLADPSPYFRLNSRNGALKIAKSLQGLVTSGRTKSFDLRVSATGKSAGQEVQVSTTVSVVVVPEYVGNPFVQSALQAVRNQSVPGNGPKTQRDRSKIPTSEFALHRLFRKPSAEAQRISKVEMTLNRALREIKREVAEGLLGGERLRTETVSVRLGPTSLTSGPKLMELIQQLNCSAPTVTCVDDQHNARYRTFDGTCNNRHFPTWGAASTTYSRMLDPVYYDEDGLSDPIGFPDQPLAPEMPTPHLVSEKFFIHRSSASPNDKRHSHMLMQWGQFLDHDITFTAESDGAETCFLPYCDGSPRDYEPPCFPISYPDNVHCTAFVRSAAACQNDHQNMSRREQLNTITAYIDGSQIYGSSDSEASNLRDFITNKGYLRTSSTNLLPFIKSALKPPLNLCQLFGGCFDAGDFRVNEQIALASMHTLWVREHNRIAHALYHINRHWSQERVFHEARKIVGAKLQHITYAEYLPKILGKDAIPPYNGYRNVSSSIMNGFASAAFRFGHSSVRPAFDLLDENYDPVAPAVPLIKAFFNNTLVQDTGIEPIILGLLANVSQKTNREIADGLTKHLFQQPESEHGFDLAALNIQRGRDHGLPGYGVWRRECDLSHAEIFEETSLEIKDPQARLILRDLYDDFVEVADLFVAGLAEDPVPGATVGPTFRCIIREQFRRLRDGDRFWYENPTTFSRGQIAEIKKTTLSQVLCDNVVGMVSVQRDAFIAATDDTKRSECSQIPRMNLNEWKEEQSPGAADDGEWSAWVSSVRTPTGSWAVNLGQKLCSTSIVKIECQLADGSPLEAAGQRVHCEPLVGFYCRNREQLNPEGTCRDYRFRFLCSRGPTPVPPEQKLPHFFTSPSNPQSQCDVVRHPSDFPLTFDATEHVTIQYPYDTDSGTHGFMFAGKNVGEPRRRFLLKFNTRRIPRRAIVHSAFVHVYLLDSEGTGLVGSAESNELEAYQVVSTDWKAENTTSVVPWHENFLGIGTDVYQHRLSISDTIKPEDQGRWVSVAVQHAVRNWQIRNQPNFGLMFKNRKEANAKAVMRFASASFETAELRPKLIVCLTIPPW